MLRRGAGGDCHAKNRLAVTCLGGGDCHDKNRLAVTCEREGGLAPIWLSGQVQEGGDHVGVKVFAGLFTNVVQGFCF